MKILKFLNVILLLFISNRIALGQNFNTIKEIEKSEWYFIGIKDSLGQLNKLPYDAIVKFRNHKSRGSGYIIIKDISDSKYKYDNIYTARYNFVVEKDSFSSVWDTYEIFAKDGAIILKKENPFIHDLLYTVLNGCGKYKLDSEFLIISITLSNGVKRDLSLILKKKK